MINISHTIVKIEMRKTISFSKLLYQKRYQAESTDESGGLSYKSINKNITEESFSGFKLTQNFYHSSNVLLHNKLSLSPCH